MTTLRDLTNDMLEAIEIAQRNYKDSDDFEARRVDIINDFIDEVKEKLIG